MLCLLALTTVAGCGSQTSEPDRASDDAGPVHVHGLGINPADDALFVATHTGLFRAADGETEARRVGGRYQDTMGFAVVGPNRFLGSGHPDLRERLPPYLGLIESADAGRSWKAVSLQGKVDFHVLEARGRRIYGYGSDFETRQPRFLTSTDGGRSWTRLRAPAELLSLVISPDDPRMLMASGARGIYFSSDRGRSWSELDTPAVGLLAWNADGVFLADSGGRMWRSARGAPKWTVVGSAGGPPAAFEGAKPRELLVALHDGVIKRSTDAGRSWSVRSQPGPRSASLPAAQTRLRIATAMTASTSIEIPATAMARARVAIRPRRPSGSRTLV